MRKHIDWLKVLKIQRNDDWVELALVFLLWMEMVEDVSDGWDWLFDEFWGCLIIFEPFDKLELTYPT